MANALLYIIACDVAMLYVIVCDVAMVSDNKDLDRVHQFKTNKYKITDIHRWMRQNNPRQDSGQMEAMASAFIINWSGEISLETWSSWKK